MGSGRTCTKCGVEKPESEFSKDSRSKSGLRSSCKDCERARSRAQYQKNRDRRLAYQRDYYQSHKNEAKEYYRDWRFRNKEKISTYRKRFVERHREEELIRNRIKARKYRERNPDKSRQWSLDYSRKYPERIAARNHNRRLSKKEFTVTSDEIAKIYSLPCAYCGSTDNVTLDHIVPLARGGKHSIGNLQPLCSSCNFSKSTKTMTEWKKSRVQ